MRVVVVGGGFAGMAAAIALQERRHDVVVLERRGILGGRASSSRDAVTGDDAGSVLGAAVTGEDHAVSEYEKALGEDLSDGFRSVLQRQHASVVAARDEVSQLQDAH